LTSQLLFPALGNLAVYSSAIPAGQLQELFLGAPYILFSAMVASFFGYKVTGKIMQ
jgi:hypothetical protein